MSRLYHYTCRDHGKPGIDRDGVLLPNWHWRLDTWLVWCTDLDVPLAEPLGLTSDTLNCDRTQVRYEVADPADCMPWHMFARKLRRDIREDMECPPGIPRHWWVSREPVPVLIKVAA